jgi:NDP-sugar pyrophosphorylase family protein
MPQSLPRSALLLTAGLGRRLLPLTNVRAKPAVPVAGEPLVRRIAGWLAAHDVVDLVLNLHHLPATITTVMGDGADLGVRIRYSWEPVILGSAGGPRQALPLLNERTFFIVNGDTLTDVDLRGLAAAHASSNAVVTLALAPNHEPGRYGGVRLDGESRVIGFVPRGSAADGSFHFLGVQITNGNAFASLPAGRPSASIGGVYDDLVAKQPGAIAGYVSNASFWDVGTVADYWKTSQAFLDKDAADGGWVGREVSIDTRARISRSLLWDNVSVGAGCVLDECIVTDGVHVPDGMSYHRQILRLDGTTLAVTPLEID